MIRPRIFASPADLMGTEGTRLGPTEWLTIDQARVDGFAEVTGDHQWVHTDPERARSGPFGGTIAHGYLTMSLVNCFLPQMVRIDGVAAGVNIGADRLRFLAPVRTGTRIRAAGEILSVTSIRGAIQAVVRVEIEIENGEKPACSVETISRYYPEAA
jgi:acyl dehydratase